MILIYNPDLSDAMLHTLKNLGAWLIPSLRLPQLPKGISGHPDIQIHSIDDKTAICAPECYPYYRQHLPRDITLMKGNSPLFRTYPNDCAYNAARIGNFVFCNTACCDSRLLTEYQNRGYTIVHTKQGYTKCNLCVITDKFVFTEDEGIHKTIMGNKLPIESILLPKGEISLKGYPYGFIGGAAGHAGDSILWYGSPKSCSYALKIENILRRNQKKEIVLSKEKLCDLGGIICFFR